MSYNTLSAILKHAWLISPDYAQQHLALAIRMANGELVDFGMERDENPEPVILVAAGDANAGAVAAAVYGVRPSTNLSQIQAGSIVQMDIIGPVLKYGDLCSYGSTDQAALINRLAANGNVAAIIINIDSPGGQASGTQQVADAIREAAKVKPVVGIIDDGMAASAAMWMASACTELYVTKKTDEVGSIGVYMTLANWYEYAKKQGLPVRDIYAPQSTDKNGPYREALAGNDEPLKNELAELADAFINAVKTNRAGKLTSDEWTTGKMYNAKKATKIGLIDGIKSYSQTIKRVEQLINTRHSQNTINMTAFAKFMAASGITAIAVVDGGFLVSEETLNAIENKLTENETAISGHQAAVDALNATITERDATISTMENPATFADQLAAKDQTISELQTQIQANNARIAELEAKPQGSFAQPVKEGGDHQQTVNANKFRTSYDAEMETVTALMDTDKK